MSQRDPLPGKEIHVWSARLDSTAWPSATRLPAAERERAARLLKPEKRRRWVAARWALRRVLAAYLELDPAQIELPADTHAKPAMPSPTPLRFNLSHSRGLALVAISPAAEIGVDLEWIDRRRDVMRIAPRALGVAAARQVAAAPRASRQAAFHSAWTRREAVAKCLGDGVWAALPELPVAVSEIDAGAGYAAAVAVAGPRVPALRRFTIDPGTSRGTFSDA